MKIKEVEDLIGITKANIRFYEKEGLLNPGRNEENNYREYTEEDVRSLERIKTLRLLGITIAEIKQMNDGQVPLKDVIENRLKKIREEEQNLQEIRQICNLILENNISFTAVDEKMLDGRKESWKAEFERIWHEDITKEMLTRNQFNRNIAAMLFWGYLLNEGIAGLFGNRIRSFPEEGLIWCLVASAVVGSLCYIAVNFTADMRIHMALFHGSALILTPLVMSVYRFFQMLFYPSNVSAGTVGRIQMQVFWAMLLVYVAVFFYLAEKWGPDLKDVHMVVLSAAYSAVMTALYGFVWGKWLFWAAAFLAFTLYIGTVWKDALAVEKNCSRYYAVSTGCRIINICGSFWNMYGKTSVSGWVRR